MWYWDLAYVFMRSFPGLHYKLGKWALWYSPGREEGQNLLSGKVARMYESLLKYQETMQGGAVTCSVVSRSEMSGESMISECHWNIWQSSSNWDSSGAANLIGFGCTLLKITQVSSLENRPCIIPNCKHSLTNVFPRKLITFENSWWLLTGWGWQS